MIWKNWRRSIPNIRVPVTEEFYEVTPQCWNLLEVNRQLLTWARTYNTIRPHQALGYATPLEFLQRHDKSKIQNPKVSLVMWTSTVC
jgi:hypothetical protein